MKLEKSKNLRKEIEEKYNAEKMRLEEIALLMHSLNSNKVKEQEQTKKKIKEIKCNSAEKKKIKEIKCDSARKGIYFKHLNSIKHRRISSIEKRTEITEKER